MGRPPRRADRSSVLSAEQLEGRLLMAADRGPLAKIGPALAAAAASATPSTVAVEAYANPGGARRLARAERRLGATDVLVHGRSVSADVPTAALRALAAVPSLRFARADAMVTHVGTATSQGDVTDRANVARSTYGLTGAGTTVGIVSDSYNVLGGAAADVATGDLPSGVRVLSDGPAGSTDEGRAMAQTAYDSAPGASLAFATGQGGQATMAANIRSLVSAGAKVIVDDVSYLAEPMFQDGPIAQAVAAATAAGVSYFAAAGETADRGYASAWRSAAPVAAGAIPAAPDGTQFYGGTPFNFATDGTTNTLNSFTLGPGQSLTLSFQWDSPSFSVSGGSGSPNQVDAYVLNAAGTALVGGGVSDDVGGDPVQVFTYTNSGPAAATYNLMLVAESGLLPGYVKYVDFGGAATGFAYGFNSGTIFGHANAAPAGTGLEAVASTSALQSPQTVEPTSAAGTTPILFDVAGNRLTTPIVRQSPGITAPDGGDTTFFGVQTNDGDAYPNFFGTSAAAAAAAGVAALLLQAAPTLSPTQLDAALQSTAADLGPAGVDARTGYGLIQADAAVAAAVNGTTGTVAGTVFQDNNGNAALDAGEAGLAGQTVYVDANGNGTRDAGEPSTAVNADGTFAIAGVTAGSGRVVRVVVPNGYVATVAGRTVAVTAAAVASGVTLGLFPFAFLGTAGNDAYAVIADPVNKNNVDITGGGGPALTIARASLPSLIFATGGGDDALTVSFANGAVVPAGGLTFDGGTGTDAITVVGATGGDTATFVGSRTTFDSATILTSNVASQTVNGGGGSDNFSVTDSLASGQTLTVNGGLGTTTFAVRANLANNGAGCTFNSGTAAGMFGVLNVNVGPYAIIGDPSVTSANLTVNANAPTIFAAAAAGAGVNTRTVAAINVGSSGTVTVAAPASHADRTVVVAGSLSVASGGKVDLAGNDVVVQAGNAATLTALAATGFAGGTWAGKGITSSAAAADAAHLTAVGVIANTQPGSTAPLYSAANRFDGVVAPAAAAVLLKSTYYGDANLDGVVNAADYTRVDAGAVMGLTGWANGDVNFDGAVDGSDYALIDNAFDQQSAGL